MFIVLFQRTRFLIVVQIIIAVVLTVMSMVGELLIIVEEDYMLLRSDSLSLGVEVSVFHISSVENRLNFLASVVHL